ncbi:MAG TPA: DegQ family serine endoprotease [Candidatus Acidoferrales bacterium]|jgi:serine protease Do|nr:DegQ family serine endoprotease [Candidatus Acidoferrales bacterium]
MTLRLIAAVVVIALGVSFLIRPNREPRALAAGKGLDGPEIDLLEQQNKAYERIIQTVAPSIVYVRTEQIVKAEQSPMFMDPLFRQFFGAPSPQAPSEQKEHALGTGVVFDPEGYIVTNNHVIDHATSVEVMLPDHRTFKAKVVGADPDTDIAVVKIDAKGLSAAALGNSSTLHVGDTVMAFGNPFGLNFTVTRGTVSALGRSEGGIEAVQDFIQTDAAINPGNSGGALVNVRAEMVGINTAILSGNSGPEGEGGFIGIGFAIPMNMAKRVMESLVKTGKVTRGYMGATIGPVTEDLAQEFKVPDTAGAFVQDVAHGGPAEKAGVKPGDVIRRFNDEPVNSANELLAMVANTNPGTLATLEVLRNGQPLTVKLTLEERPSNLEHSASERKSPSEGPLRGITVGDLTPALRKHFQLPTDTQGVVVSDIDPDSPAAQTLEQGDVILSINQQPVNSAADFDKLAAEAKGRTLLRIIHQGQALFVVVSPEEPDNQ